MIATWIAWIACLVVDYWIGWHWPVGEEHPCER